MLNKTILTMALIMMSSIVKADGPAMTIHTFSGVQFKAPSNFIPYVHQRPENNPNNEHAKFYVLVERGHTQKEPKVGLSVMVSDLPMDYLQQAQCNYARISYFMEKLQLEEMIPEEHRENGKIITKRFSDVGFAAYVEKILTGEFTRIVHFYIVGEGKLIDIMVTNDEKMPLLGLGYATYKSVEFLEKKRRCG